MKSKLRKIIIELKNHAPFTSLGAILGILFMLLFRNVSGVASHHLFMIFHPGHVILSAIVTSSMFILHTGKKTLIIVLLVGYFGSVGIATLSDIIIPEIGSELMGLKVPSHAQLHQHNSDHDQTTNHNNHSEPDHETSQHQAHEHKEGLIPGIHLGFIEDWYIVNPAAILGVIIALMRPGTKFPHAGHVLIGTWASSAYLLMGMQSEFTIATAIGIFFTLFLATWLPCCLSDIVFPLLLTKSKNGQTPPPHKH